MNSALYSGWVSHRRFSPKAHAFRYRIGMLYLDLEEQDAVMQLSPLAGGSRLAPFSFRPGDYLREYTGRGVSLTTAVRDIVRDALGRTPLGRVCLLTQARSWGLSFNPVSFFYCFERNGNLAAIVCEVTNTPWRERYHYVLPANAEGHQHFSVAKGFHVSPFLHRDLEYRMSFSQPGDRLGVHMADWHGEHKVFDATLNLQRLPLSRAALHRHLLSFPWMTAKTGLAIYWQALRLFVKRLPIFPHQAAEGSYRSATVQKDRRHEKQ
ncbi:hypothetical protein SAMN03159444_01830 [Pseudomonas sp. NFACC02]|uniref:DUF1365 domain-containing protein n=1 Tax=Pseudomonas sp. NFACC02 TaxID=1566250 RepID=UPI0008CD1EF5|nr:DUF1365 domain-containing protein [Pseudomonas sp. NFACC02]SEQ49680.1 hypothetical protein SAMN03159444_01830 [Pseudomonas sp. NFACC02]